MARRQSAISVASDALASARQHRDRIAGLAARADAEVKLAERRIRQTYRGRRRLQDIAIRLLDAPELRKSIDVARLIYSTAFWYLAGDVKLAQEGSEADHRHAAAKIARCHLRGEALTALPRISRMRPIRFDNHHAASILGVTWADRQRLRLEQVAATDLSVEEYKAALADARRERDAQNKMEKRRNAGLPTESERRAEQARMRALWQGYADALGLSVKTTKAKARAGQIEPVEAWATGVGFKVKSNSADACCPTAKDGGGTGAFSAPAPSSNVAVLRRAAGGAQ